MFFKLLRYDCKVGIIYHYKKLIAVLVLFVCVYLDCFMQFRSYATLDTPFTVENTLGNTLLYIFAGIQEYDPQIDTQFIFPAVWMLLYLVLAYFTLYYPYNDLEESGQNILLRSGFTAGTNIETNRKLKITGIETIAPPERKVAIYLERK